MCSGQSQRRAIHTEKMSEKERERRKKKRVVISSSVECVVSVYQFLFLVMSIIGIL